MSKLAVAKDVVRGASLPDELRKYGEKDIGRYAVDAARCLYYARGASRFLTTEVTPDVLADSLHYFVDLDTKPVGGEGEISMGASKVYGLPHLPDSIDWPAGQYFLAQINLKELHRFDVDRVFPEQGMLYFFFSPAMECAVIHFDGGAEALNVREYPDVATLPDAKYYLDDFVNGRAEIRFTPRYIFYLDGDGYDTVEPLIPPDLRRQLDELLGCSLATSDPSFKLFGRPHYWQGEDEAWEADGEGRKDVLLLEDDFGEGSIHFWLEPAALASREFSSASIGYSGT